MESVNGINQMKATSGADGYASAAAVLTAPPAASLLAAASQDCRLMESSLARRRAGTSSNSLTKKRARDSPSVGLGDATDGHMRAATPRAAPPTPPLLAQDYTDGNINKVWMHGSKLAGQGFKCGYCGSIYKGGGATRFRDHLGCIVSEVKSCPNVPRAVRDAMRELRKRSINYPYFLIAMRLAKRLAENDEEQNDEDGFEDDLA